MITFKAYPHGRCGNALFQYAFIRALSQRNGVDWALPLWGGSRYFSMKWNEDTGIKVDLKITEFDGRIIQMENFINAKTINLKMDAEPGIYLVTITTINDRAVFKIMKK